MLQLPTLTRRSAVAALITVLAVALYVGWWFSLAIHAEKYFHAWQNSLAAQGATSAGQVSIRGFPFAVTVHVHEFSYEKPGVLKITSPDLMVRLRPWTPFRPTALSNEPTTFVFSKAGYTLKAGRFEMSFVKPWFGPYNAQGTGLVVNAHFNALQLDDKKPMALGNNVAEVSFTAKVKGHPPDIFSATSLSAWRDAGSVVEIQWLKMLWGPLTFNGSGSLAIDKTFQPQAAFNGRVAGYDKAIDALRDAGQVKPMVASLFKAALKLLENQKKNQGEEPTVSIPATVQNNSLAVAGVILARWEPFPWP